MGRQTEVLIERHGPLLVRALSVLIVAAGSWLTPVHSWAQSTRPYQMTLLGSADAHIDESPPPVINYNATVDVPAFYFGRERTPERGAMIVWIAPTNDMSIYDALDWSRVLAVYVDEPYITALAPIGGEGTGSPCPSPSDPRAQILQGMSETLGAMAATARARAPKARFWVNFHRSEVDWMKYFGCALNHAFMDVVSVDIYGEGFNSFVQDFYDYLYAHRPTPHQQLALVPGTHTSPAQSEFLAWWWLQEYFAYAHNQNQTCDLPLGPVGTTGFYDGCRVWMVAGWIGGANVFQNHYPIEHPNSQLVWDLWEAVAAKPKTPPPADYATFNRLWVSPVLKILLD